MAPSVTSKHRYSLLGVAGREAAPGVRARFLAGFSYSAVGALAAQVSVLLTAVLMARLLEREAFGRVAAIQTSLAAVFNASTFGLGITATRYTAEFRRRNPERVGRILGLCSAAAAASGVLSTLVLIFISGPVTSGLLRAPELAVTLRIGAPYCAFMTMNAYQTGALLGFEAFQRLVVLQVCQGIAGLAAGGALTMLFGINGAAASLTVVAVCNWALGQRALRRECRKHGVQVTYGSMFRELGVLRAFVLPSTLSGFISNAGIWMSSALLARQTGGFAQMGMYSAAASLRNMTVFAPSLLNRVAAPILASFERVTGHAAYLRTLYWNAVVNTLLALAGALVVWLAAPWLLRGFGRQFDGARALVLLLAASAVIEVYATSAYQAIFRSGRMFYQAAIVSLWAAILATCAWRAVPRLGAAGLALGYLAAWMVSAAAYTLAAKKLNRAALAAAGGR